jgi:hypothetical protein
MTDDRSLRDEIRRLVDRQADAVGTAGPGGVDPALDFEKWRLIHKYVHDHPFATRERPPRSEQWREAASRVRDLGEPELLDWTLLQAEIAGNLEHGIQDLRPRKNGPCHCLVLEYVANRKRKALAVLRFAQASDEEGVYRVNSDFHARTQEILGDPADEADPGSGGHEAVPWVKREDGE